MVMDAPGFVATDVAQRGSAIGDYATQIRYEVRLLKRVPEMKIQLENHQLLLKALEKNERALAAGFSPYRPPSDWGFGFLSAPATGAALKYNLYRRAMPASVIKAYTRAKALHLPNTNDMVFSFFTVHSPDESIFEKISIELPRKDPILVGWIGKGSMDFNSSPVGAAAVLNKLPAESVEPRSASYLIGAWDLATDLAFQRR